MVDAHPDNPQPAALAAPNRKVYRGNPNNQRDPNAISKPFPKKGGGGGKQTTRSVPASLPKPSLKEKNQGGTISAGNPADASLFSTGISVRETVPRQTFTPGASALPEIAASTFSELLTDNPNLGKILLPEYLQYYATAMLWCRIISLKDKNSQPLNEHEQNLLMIIQTTSFSIPEPIMLQLRALGNIVTATKQHLYPEFPSLPMEVIQEQGGYYGTLLAPAPEVNDLLHNLYEEIPCLGVMAYAIRMSISNRQPGAYDSTVTFNNQQPTQNLLGFRPLSHRRNEAKNLALDTGITENQFPSYPNNSAFNLDLLAAISNVLATTTTFKMNDVVFGSLSEIGAQSQIVIERPIVTVPAVPAVRGEIRPTCLIKENESIFGSGIFFASQLMKVEADNNASWKLFNNIPEEWIANRDARRNLPDAYLSETFQSVSQQASGFRTNIIKSMVLTKR